jgi:hypothetical protein
LLVVPYCFLGSRVLAREGTDILESDPTCQSQIGDAFPLRRSWLDSAIVDLRSYLCYFDCRRGRQNNKKKGPLQRSFNIKIFHSFTQTASPGL